MKHLHHTVYRAHTCIDAALPNHDWVAIIVLVFITWLAVSIVAKHLYVKGGTNV